MVEYIVRYHLSGEVYESRVRTSSSGAAIRWVGIQFPNATAVRIV